MQKSSEIGERILEIIEYLNLNPSSFSKKLGYNRAQAIYDITNGKSQPSFDFFRRLYDTDFSEKINFEWLITGRGQLEKVKESKFIKGDNINELNLIRDLAAENALLKKELEELKGRKRVHPGGYGSNVAEP